MQNCLTGQWLGNTHYLLSIHKVKEVKKTRSWNVEMLIPVPTEIHAAMAHSSGRNEWLQARTVPASARAPLDSAAFAKTESNIKTYSCYISTITSLNTKNEIESLS